MSAAIRRTRGASARRGGVFLALLTLASLIVSLLPLLVATPSARAADASDWDPGQIISDSVFYNSNALNAGQIQDFLNARVSTCRATSVPCLKDYAQSTDNRPADKYCNGYQGKSRETAAQILDNVARSCGISQKALIVLLEKEQGLVTSSNPSTWSYTAATGQGCPDTAACDESTAGFFYQVYYAARQFEIYRLNPSWWGYQAGRWNNILYNPNSGCGTQRVFIQNQATAGLYIYTPYVPNQAALNNLYGTGDSCSAYGNRNFWRLFTDWFGNPKVDVRARIDAAYAGLAGAGGWLGSPVADYSCGLPAAGCYRAYENGRVYASETAPGASVNPVIQRPWDAQGGVSGVFGYPRAEAFVVGGGWLQSYDGGVAVLPDGRDAQFVAGQIGLAWINSGGLSSSPGAPTSQMYCGLAAGGCVQIYVNGWYYSSAASDGHWVRGPVLQAWSDRGSESGSFGYPLTDPQRDAATRGEWARFQGGVIFVDAGQKVWEITGAAAATYADEAAAGRPLGAPMADRRCAGGGCVQKFSNGLLVQPDGAAAQVLTGAIAEAWLADGSFSSRAGAPTGGTTCGRAQGGCRQSFANGDYAWTRATGARLVPKALLKAWTAAEAEGGSMGYPQGAPIGLTGGSVQSFQGGVGAVSSTGQAQFVAGQIGVAWLEDGAFSSRAGAPAGPLLCGLDQGGCAQAFTNATYAWTNALGAQRVDKNLVDAWRAVGGEAGAFGYPRASAIAMTGGSVQSFQGGVGVVPKNGTPQFIAGPIGAAWLNAGAFSSPAGAPSGALGCGLVQGGCVQPFTKGWSYWSPDSGAQLVPNALLNAWSAAGSEAGSFGYPLAAPVSIKGGTVQSFQGGVGVVATSNAAQFVAGPIGVAWLNAGAFSSRAGAPLSPQTCDGARQSCTQLYAGGTYSWTSTGGVRFQAR